MNTAGIRNLGGFLCNPPFPQVQDGTKDKGGVSRTSYSPKCDPLSLSRKRCQADPRHLFLNEISRDRRPFERESIKERIAYFHL